MAFPKITLGTWNFGDTTGTYAKQSDEVEDAIVKAALDAGINAFDTAEAYANGVSERALGRALRKSGKARNEYLLLSKISPDNIVTPELIEASLNRTLANLNTPYLDLYQIHWPNHSIDIKPALQVLAKFQKEGKIKAIGVSNFGPIDMGDAISSGVTITTNQLPYSLFNRAIEFEIITQATDSKVGILAYSPLAQGLLSGKYKKPEDCHDGLSRSRYFHKSRSPKCRHTEEGCEKELFEALATIQSIADKLNVSPSELAIAWLLKQPGVTSAVVGASKPEHIAQNVKALSINITDEINEQLKAVTEPIKKALGSNPDMWAAQSRYR